MTYKRYTGDSHPTMPLNVVHDEGSRSFTIIDSIDEIMSAYIIHQIQEINRTDELIRKGKTYYVDLTEVDAIDEEGEPILDDKGNPVKILVEEQIWGDSYVPEEIHITLGSCGGSLHSSTAIMECLESSKTPIHLHITETCMSGATIIASSRIAKKTASPMCRWLLHNLSHTTGWDNLAHMKDSIAESEYLSDKMKQTYIDRVNVPKELLDKIFSEHVDYYFDTETARKWGFLTE